MKEYYVGMKTRQYTVREVSTVLDYELRTRAKKSGESLNSTVLQVLKAGLGLADDKPLYHDLDHLSGSWAEDEELNAILKDMREIDSEMWQ